MILLTLWEGKRGGSGLGPPAVAYDTFRLLVARVMGMMPLMTGLGPACDELGRAVASDDGGGTLELLAGFATCPFAIEAVGAADAGGADWPLVAAAAAR